MTIGVVLVTYNRFSDLKKALKAYESQTRLPAYIIVVNNCSTDETKEYLEEWQCVRSVIKKFVVNMEENTGGAGGFYAGLEEAVKMDAEWVWVSDDDAFPYPDAFEQMINKYTSMIEQKKTTVSALCSAVINKGEIHLQHRNYLKLTPFKVKLISSSQEDYQKGYFEIDIFSYVGTAINLDALKKVGLTDKDLFIYGDDQEHSIRLRKYGKIYCIPDSKVQHDTPGFSDKVLFWGHYYHYRNHLLIVRKYYPFRFVIRWIKRYAVNVLFNLRDSKEKKELLNAAYLDALKGKKGIHETYRPGWKPKDYI